MHGVDVWILLVIVISAIIGLMRGLARELIALITLILALIIGFHYTEWLMPLLGGLMVEHAVRVWVARIALFALVMVIGQLVGVVVGFIVNRIPVVSLMNRLLGAAFGLVRGILLVGVLTLLSLEWHLNQYEWWQQSRMMASAEHVASWVQMLSGPWTVAAVNELKSESRSESTPDSKHSAKPDSKRGS
jgi:membrane protein required for colicin V production